ncbi:MAG: sigma-70 family RNA polymerase sigma factor [Alphaproteobacteria bacterium]
MTGQQQKPRKIDDKPGPAGSFENLLRAVAEHKDRESFVQLFNYFAPRIKSYLMKGGTPEDQADELAQETMLAVWNRAESFDPAQAGVSTWIFTIARNKRIDAFRKRQNTVNYEALGDEQKDESDSPAETVNKAQETQAMEAALGKLPGEQAELLYKSFFENKSHGEIATEMKLSLGTVKSRIRLALEKLRQDEKVKKLWH